MLEKLNRMEKNYTELADSLSDPAVLADNRLYAEKMREYKRMTPIIETYHAYLHAMQQRDEAKELLQENDGDAELKELAQEEYHTAKAACEDLHEKLIFLLLPTRTMTRTSSLKSAAVLVGKKQHCLPIVFTGCTPCMRNRRAGSKKF